MNKINILILMLLIAPIFTFLLFSQDNTTTNNIIYLHQEQKTTRSAQEHLNSFSGTGDVIIDFYADWCPPCNRMSPIIDAIATIMPNITFIKINRDYFSDLAKTFNVTSIPTLIFLRNGKEIGRYNGGPLTRDKLAKIIAQIYRNQ